MKTTITLLFYTLLVSAQTYDNQNRITSITYPDSTIISYTYDAVGNRITETVDIPYANSLPIQLEYFRATKEGCKVHLNWVTASEINNSHFEVQHSMDGITFTTITTVEGAGNSVGQQSYHHLHQTPRKGVNYYRLRQVDYDGTTTNSPLQAEELNDCFSENMKIYPNPVRGQNVQVEINAQGNIQRLEVYNASGQLLSVRTTQIGHNLWLIEAEKLSAGIYEVRAVFEDTRALIDQLIIGE